MNLRTFSCFVDIFDGVFVQSDFPFKLYQCTFFKQNLTVRLNMSNTLPVQSVLITTGGPGWLNELGH